MPKLATMGTAARIGLAVGFQVLLLAVIVFGSSHVAHRTVTVALSLNHTDEGLKLVNGNTVTFDYAISTIRDYSVEGATYGLLEPGQAVYVTLYQVNGVYEASSYLRTSPPTSSFREPFLRGVVRSAETYANFCAYSPCSDTRVVHIDYPGIEAATLSAKEAAGLGGSWPNDATVEVELKDDGSAKFIRLVPDGILVNRGARSNLVD